MVAIDLDGTLFDSKSRISSKNKKAIEDCRNAGIKVVLVSGKPCLIVGKLAKSLKLAAPQVSYSGAMIIENYLKIVFEVKIPAQLSKEIIRCCREWRKGFVLGVNDGFLYYESRHPYLKIITDTGDKVVKAENLESDEFIESAIMFSISGYENDGFEEYLKNKINSAPVKVVRGSPSSILAFHKDVDKFSSVLKIMDMYGISKDELMAIGDSNNDIEIIKFAGIGVAMGNSVEELKKVSDHIVPDNESSGVAFAINNYILNKKG